MAEPRRTAEDDEEDTPRRRAKKNPNESEFYKVGPGFTSTLGISEGGEVLSHEQMGNGFAALSEEEQLDKWGMVRYAPFEPSDEQRRAHRLGREVRAGTTPQRDVEIEEEEDLGEDATPTERTGEVIDPSDLKDLSDDDLWQTAQAEGLTFPRDTPRNIVEGALTKKMREDEAAQKQAASDSKPTTKKK
jgi:hypothetical protein